MKNFEDRIEDIVLDIYRRLNAKHPWTDYPRDPLEVIEQGLRKFYREIERGDFQPTSEDIEMAIKRHTEKTNGRG